MPFFEKKDREKGQILLIVVLVSVISLTVGLSAVSRSITNTRVSTEESNSQKALTAAEAGLEDQIKRARGGDPSSQTFDNNSGYSAKTTEISGKTRFLINNFEIPVSQHEGADIWLTNYPDFGGTPYSGTLTIYWTGPAGNCSDSSIQPAIEIVIVHGNKANPSLTRYPVDACRANRNNGFNNVSSSGSLPFESKTFKYSYTLPVAISNGYIARIIPIYGDTKIGVASSSLLPAQGFEIESTGDSGDTVRKVKLFQSYPSLPIEIFPYNLFNS